MAYKSGPRRLVFNHLQKYQPHNVTAPQKTDSQKDNLQKPDVNSINIHSSSIPSLPHSTTLHATFTQKISWDGGAASDMVTTQSFTTSPAMTTLDSSLVHSVYPPAGQSDYWNVLPHMLFNDLQIPWMMNTSAPWFGLLCFTHSELLLSADELTKIATESLPLQGPNLTVGLSEAEFAKAANETATASKSEVNAIFISKALFHAIFKGDSNGGDSKRFEYLTHVRTVNTTGMANMVGNEAGTYAVSVSARPGPQQVPEPTVVYAHLVMIPPNEGSSQYNSEKCGLRSLYSWSYTCLPTSHFSISKAFQTLGSSQQPLRNPDKIVTKSKDPSDAWVQRRMLAGYSLARYRPITGETSMCLFRGPLIPNNPFDMNLALRDMPPSDVGTDLAILDREVGLLDLSFQLAWNLGRTLAMADRGFSAAWIRLKRAIHNDALNAAKTTLDKGPSTKSSNTLTAQSVGSRIPAFHPILPTLSSINGLHDNLWQSSVPKATPNNGDRLVSRWMKSNTLSGARALCTLVNPDVKSAYCDCLTTAACNMACCHDQLRQLRADQAATGKMTSAPPYDELRPPTSTDYALVLGWILDKWFLHGIPMYNLIPDPTFLPNESLRTFYVDPTWFKTFIDGALSMGDHFTPDDDARESVKDRLTTYLNTPLSDGLPSPIPRWGFLIRSALISKFPDLRISAPWNAVGVPDPNRLEVIRMERIDDDLLLVLFDRIPGPANNLFQVAIQPPEHQLCFMLGTFNSWNTENNVSSFDVEWRSLTMDGTNLKAMDPPVTKYWSSDSNSPFDFDNNIVNSSRLASQALARLAPTRHSSAALVGSQLVAEFPQLVLQGGAADNRTRGPPTILNSLSTSRKRVPSTLKFTRPVTLRASPPSASGPPRPSPSPLPTNGILRSQLPGLVTLVDGEIYIPDMVQTWFYDGHEQDGYGRSNMKPQFLVAPPGSAIPRLWLQIYNVHGRAAGMVDLYNTFAVYPLSLDMPTDLNVFLLPRPRVVDRGWLLTSIRIAFGVGSRQVYTQGPLFMPFPTSTTTGSNLNSSPSPSSARDFQRRPDYQGRKLPVVRGVGKGNGWLFKTEYPAPDGSERFVVTAYPNRVNPAGGKAAYDTLDMPELAFVIEDVQMGWVPKGADHPGAQPLLVSNVSDIITEETYSSTPDPRQPLSIKGTTYTKVSALGATVAGDYQPIYLKY